ncbi:MAG TPA: NAD(P)H-hydrate dehydratase [Methylophilaceae bacterium]|nr:NAD(P)H-hydrate dehydratase [Methylophilaceae bacterium]
MMTPPLFRTSEIRAIEQAHGTAGLMEKAGLAVATLAKELLPEDAYSILIVAGPGNNGGDALVAARYLKAWWLRVDVFFTGDPDRMPADAATAYRAWLDAGGELLSTLPEKPYDLIIDGLFGIGLAKPLHGNSADLVHQINTMEAPVLAIDVPSGLCANTGRVLGTAVIADHTLTFLGLKPGLFTLDGVDYAGTVHSSDLGVDTGAVAHPQGWLLNEIPALPEPRLRNSHKGSNGSIGVLGGDTAMVGAALLAARAALLIGAGRVYAGLLAENAPTVDPVQPELMLRDGLSLLDSNHLTAVVAGPGLGRSEHAKAALHRALLYPAPLVLDADALVLLAVNTELHQSLAARKHPTLLTPHPGEAAALLACSVADVQADRIASALQIAEKYGAVVLLKGAGTVIAMPDGQWFVNASGNPGLAAAGMGDTLAGIIGGLAAQGMALDQAALLGTYLHGAAADALVAEGIGPFGLTASEVALAARELINLWITQEHP